MHLQRFAVTFLIPIFSLVQLIQYLNDYISLDKGSYVSMKDLTMSSLSDGIKYRNHIWQKIGFRENLAIKCKRKNGVSAH